jgi:hypothetical protein
VGVKKPTKERERERERAETEKELGIVSIRDEDGGDG